MSNGPRGRRQRPVNGRSVINNLPTVEVSFDKDAFSNAVQSHGVYMVHYRAIPDPVGMASKGDNHGVLAGPKENSDGWIYKKAGECRVLFTTNTMNQGQQTVGLLNFATAYITLPEKYEDNDQPIIVSPWDRFYLREIEARVIHKQYFECNSVGVDRMQYPVTCVEHLIDAHGVEYQEKVHFEIDSEGNIKWLGQERPGWNINVGRGTVCSIRFRYTPFFVAARLIHEIRIAAITDPLTLERKVERMPYQVQIVREHVFKDMNIDPNNPGEDERFTDMPSPAGAMGPPDPSGALGPK